MLTAALHPDIVRMMYVINPFPNTYKDWKENALRLDGVVRQVNEFTGIKNN